MHEAPVVAIRGSHQTDAWHLKGGFCVALSATTGADQGQTNLIAGGIGLRRFARGSFQQVNFSPGQHRQSAGQKRTLCHTFSQKPSPG
jgi:hypothetical protein